MSKIIELNSPEIEAKRVWNAMNDDDRYGVQFGLFPEKKMLEAEGRCDTHQLAVELMKLAG